MEGTADVEAVGLPPPTVGENAERLRLDLLPMFEATVQRHGIRRWSVDWYSNRIRSMIGLIDKSTKGSMKFVCRYDPDDLSKIWLFDHRHGHYIDVPYRTISHPTLTLFQVREAKRWLAARNMCTTNIELIHRAAKEMQKVLDDARKATSATRRANQRLADAKKKQSDRQETEQSAAQAAAANSQTRDTSASFGGSDDGAFNIDSVFEKEIHYV
jgi:putative transposase